MHNAPQDELMVTNAKERAANRRKILMMRFVGIMLVVIATAGLTWLLTQ